MAREIEESNSRDSPPAAGSRPNIINEGAGQPSDWRLLGSMELVEDLEDDSPTENTELKRRLAKTIEILFEQEVK